MHYLEFLDGLHVRLAPRTYLEIGVSQGHSLALSRCRSIGIDPDFEIVTEQLAPVRLFRRTSDEYFGRLAAARRRPFPVLPIDFAYIDGMHLFEYALRDFISVERYAAPSSVIAVDDVLPRDAEEAARDRREWPWTGDVFRIGAALRAHRPDLEQILVDTEPTGTLLIAHLDPGNQLLADALDDILREFVVPDPQEVPADVLARTGAMPAEEALALPLWDELRSARVPPATARRAVGDPRRSSESGR